MKHLCLMLVMTMAVSTCAPASPDNKNSGSLYIQCERTSGDPYKTTIYRIEPGEKRWSWWNSASLGGEAGPRWEVFDCDETDDCRFDDATLEFGWGAGEMAETISVSRLSGEGERSVMHVSDLDRWSNTSIECAPSADPVQNVNRQF